MNKKKESKSLENIENHFRLCSLLLSKDYLISEAEQAKELRSLRNISHLDVFYFVADIPSFSITHFGGLDKWLGYINRNFTLQDFLWVLILP